ncbi:TniQ family protein [Mycobacterium intracellulare]|uniref:TniQ family protein n=1 Tax=Mycobacterium intracellulare TaxID=1767 RepID=UPI001CDA8F1B|nr:TniQ family protein [Mycobacterium intracellulare]MCA2255186.1 TniQ family protein [Mycobacterium intracellulare]
MTAALDILRAPTLNAAADRARWLIKGQNRETGPAELHSCSREGTVSAAIIIRASAAWMGPINQLRYRTVLPAPRPPDRSQLRLQRLAASVPAVFWPAWSARFIVEGTRAINLRPVLSAATLLVGTSAHLTEVMNQLGAISAQAVKCYLFALSHSPAWPTISTAIVRLNDFLAEQPAPINYTRRRQLDYSALLPLDRWQQICRTAGDLPGAGRKAIAARYYLAEKISGSPTRTTAINHQRAHSQSLWNQVRDFTRVMTAQLREHLDDEARQFLQRNAIHEPLTWQPPLDVVSDLALPAPDPAAIDRQELRRLAVDGSYTVGQLAAHFGIDSLTVRYLFDEEPIDLNHYPLQSRPGKAVFASRLRAELGEQTLRDLYVDGRLSLRQIAGRYGINVHRIQDLVAQYGIPMRRRVNSPSRAWLAEQRFDKRRTIADIANEVGVHPATLSLWLSQVGLKKPATTYHQSRLPPMDTQAAIELLKPALTNKYGPPWLQMLTKAVEFPSIPTAERDLGLGTGTLRRRLGKLETALGAPVITRNAAGLAMAPTPFGIDVVRAVQALHGTVTISGTNPPGVAPRLTVHVAPLPGEALDSWLETTAHRCRTSLADLLGAVGLTQGSKGPRWIVVMTPDELRSVSKATGITQRQLRTMTLQRYDGVAIDIDHGRRVVARTRYWGFGAGSRYCPACLAQTQGRWKIEWRLVWSFACRRHQCLLADTCPSCGNYPRVGARKPDAVPQPGRCASPPRGNHRGGKRRCLADLTDTKVLKVPSGHPVLEAQRHIDHLLAGANAARPSTEWTPSLTLDDIATHARQAIKDPMLLSDVVPPDLLAAAIPHQGTDLHTTSRSQLSRLFKPSAYDVAAGTLLALAVLNPGRR